MNNFVKVLLVLVLVSFFAMIFASCNGYYERKLGNRVTLTNDAIERFENDLANGVDIDINDYVSLEVVNYDNKVSSFGKSLSNRINSLFSYGIKMFFKSIDKLIND